MHEPKTIGRYEIPSCPCSTCGEPTTFTGTKKCNNCWEVERRLQDYLNKGGVNAREFVVDALKNATR